MMIEKKHRRLCLATVLFGLAILCLVLFKPEPAPPTAKHSDLHDHSSHPCNHANGPKQNRPSSHLVRNASAKPIFRPQTAKHRTGIAAAETNYAPWMGQTNTAFRARAIIPAELLTSGSPIEKNVHISLPLFEDYTFNAIVQESFVNVNGTVSTLAHSEDSDWARAAIAYTDGELRIKILDPENHRSFAIHYNHDDGHHYALELDQQLLDEHEKCGLTDDSPFRNPPRTQASTSNSAREQVTIAPRAVVDESVASALIDVMVVYSENTVTQAGAESTILNIAAQGIALSNDVHQVSDTGMVIRLVHTEKLTGYIDSGSQLLSDNSNYQEFPVNNIELLRLRDTTDGTNDHIHTVRDQVGADFVCMLTTDPFGGLGTVSVFSPSDPTGEPDTAFNVNGWSVFDSYVPVHELGHNMGLEHSKFQAVSKGSPSSTTGAYAAGWYWHVENNIGNDGYSSIMSYDEHFDNHANTNPASDPFHRGHAEVGLFSNTVPEFNMFGQPTGHAADADARRALRERRSAYASYRTRSTLASPAISVREPSDAHSFPVDTTHPIIWESKNVSGNVKIDLYRSGIFDQTIAADTLNDGIFQWQIPPNLPQATDYKIRVSSIDSPAISALSNTTFIVSQVIYSEPLDSDPGYSQTGSWEFGAPTLANAVFGNATFGGPEAARTGTTIYDTNLSGGYGNTADQQLTSTAVNCAQFENCRLIFYGQLGITENTTAQVEVSNNGTTWTSIFSATDMAQSAWQRYELDISAVADEQPVVFFRWSLAHAGGSFQSGFAVDDVSVTGNLAKRVSYSATGFDESAANDGSITAPITLTLSAETFTGTIAEDLIANGKANAFNVPPGLAASLVYISATRADLFLSGTADAHEKDDDGTDLSIVLTDSAFTGGNASNVVDATSGNLRIDFFTNPPVGVGFTSGSNGFIQGNLNQRIEQGDSTSPVLAIPNSNHHFVNWTGPNNFTSTDNPLIVENIQSISIYTANFAVGEGTFPYSESFETGFGIWTQETNGVQDDFDWERNSGPPPTRANFPQFATGPNAANDGSFYLFVNSANNEEQTASIRATFHFGRLILPNLTFDYHMFDSVPNAIGHLFVEVSIDNGNSWAVVWSQFDDQGDQWFSESIDLIAYAGEDSVTIRFRAETDGATNPHLGDIAIDNISLVESLQQNSLRLVTPNMGEMKRTGAVTPIQWIANTVSDTVDVILLKDDAFHSVIAQDQPSNGSLSWTPSNLLAGNNFKVRVTKSNEEQVFDDSDSAFTITPTAYYANMDASPVSATTPGWILEGGWAFGQPEGGGGNDNGTLRGNPDPTSGIDGPSVVGYNLAGNYGDLTGFEYATTHAIDCSAWTNLSLNFQRWLNVEDARFDDATIEISHNGTDWNLVWSNPAGSNNDTTDDSWQTETHDVSATADGQKTVFIRWGLNSDDSFHFSGWNLDNVALSGTFNGGELAYSSTSLTESHINDGTIAGSIVITLQGTSFTADAASGGHVTVANLPDGLTATVNRASDTEMTISLQGQATVHADDDDSDAATVTFANDAFANNDAAIVANATDIPLTINFDDPDTLTIAVTDALISEDGGSTTATVSRTRSVGDVTVSLHSDKTDEATVPSTITITDGNTTSPSFQVTAHDDAETDGLQQVTLTASATNVNSGNTTVSVNDDAVNLIATVLPAQSGSVTAPTIVDPDSSPFSISATANTGFHFVSWSVIAGAATLETPTLTTTDVTTAAGARIQANFAINQYALTYLSAGNGTITGLSTQTIDHGGDGAEVTATPAPGFVFLNWDDTSTQNPRRDLAITEASSFTANFGMNAGITSFTATATSAGLDPETIFFGTWDQTPIGFDPNLDVPAPSDPRIWMIDNATDQNLNFIADYRPASQHTYWRIVVEPENAPIDLTFNLSNLSNLQGNPIAMLQPSESELAIAPAIQLTAARNTITVTQRSEYTLAIGPSVTEAVTLEAGWNWLSIPLISEAGLDDFLAPNQTPLYAGNRQVVSRGRLVRNTGAILPEIGSLVYSPEGGTSAEISGIIPDGIVDVHPGWNAITLPQEIAANSAKLLDVLTHFQVFSWSPTRRRYTKITKDTPLNKHQTYHFAPRDNTTTRYNVSATAE